MYYALQITAKIDRKVETSYVKVLYQLGKSLACLLIYS